MVGLSSIPNQSKYHTHEHQESTNHCFVRARIQLLITASPVVLQTFRALLCWLSNIFCSLYLRFLFNDADIRTLFQTSCQYAFRKPRSDLNSVTACGIGLQNYVCSMIDQLQLVSICYMSMIINKDLHFLSLTETPALYNSESRFEHVICVLLHFTEI